MEVEGILEIVKAFFNALKEILKAFGYEANDGVEIYRILSS